MIKKFAIIGVSKGWRGVQKLKARKTPKQLMGKPDPSVELHSIGVKEKILQAGRTTEKVTFERLIKKFPKQKIKAFKLAQLKGVKKVKSLGKRYNIQGLFSVKDRPSTFYKAKKGSGLPKGMTYESMGWAAPAELSAEALAVKRTQAPKALLKKHRASLSKIYKTPKTWIKRAELKSFYKAKAKIELKQAKVDRTIFRTQTVQKLDPKTGKYKTIAKYKKMTW